MGSTQSVDSVFETLKNEGSSASQFYPDERTVRRKKREAKLLRRAIQKLPIARNERRLEIPPSRIVFNVYTLLFISSEEDVDEEDEELKVGILDLEIEREDLKAQIRTIRENHKLYLAEDHDAQFNLYLPINFPPRLYGGSGFWFFPARDIDFILNNLSYRSYLMEDIRLVAPEPTVHLPAYNMTFNSRNIRAARITAIGDEYLNEELERIVERKNIPDELGREMKRYL